MCVSPGSNSRGALQSIDDTKKKAADLKAEDIPLGDGMAHQARLAIIQRREKLRAEIEAAGG